MIAVAIDISSSTTSLNPEKNFANSRRYSRTTIVSSSLPSPVLNVNYHLTLHDIEHLMVCYHVIFSSYFNSHSNVRNVHLLIHGCVRYGYGSFSNWFKR